MVAEMRGGGGEMRSCKIGGVVGEGDGEERRYERGRAILRYDSGVLWRGDGDYDDD